MFILTVMIFQSLGSALNFILDPVLSPLLSLPPLWGIIVISFILSLVISLIYKAVTDQDLMKRLKSEMKEFQKEMKELRNHPEKMMAVQKKAMETNMKYMTQSFKPTLFTFIPIILIFGWLSANLAFYPIMPNEDFSTTLEFKNGLGSEIELFVPEDIELASDAKQKVNSETMSWRMKGPAGNYKLEYDVNGKLYEQDLIISTEMGEYAKVENVVNDDLIKTITINNKPIRPLNIFGWKLGWLGTYIISSLIFSIVIRKVLKLA